MIDARDSAFSQPQAGDETVVDGAVAPVLSTAIGERQIERKKLSVRRVVKVGEGAVAPHTPSRTAPAGDAARGRLAAASGATTATGAGGPVPLKRLTAGRKEISILHDGSTYLLRITKSNKLILTKA